VIGVVHSVQHSTGKRVVAFAFMFFVSTLKKLLVHNLEMPMQRFVVRLLLFRHYRFNNLAIWPHQFHVQHLLATVIVIVTIMQQCFLDEGGLTGSAAKNFFLLWLAGFVVSSQRTDKWRFQFGLFAVDWLIYQCKNLIHTAFTQGQARQVPQK
jgi:hypothetical protein